MNRAEVRPHFEHRLCSWPKIDLSIYIQKKKKSVTDCSFKAFSLPRTSQPLDVHVSPHSLAWQALLWWSRLRQCIPGPFPWLEQIPVGPFRQLSPVDEQNESQCESVFGWVGSVKVVGWFSFCLQAYRPPTVHSQTHFTEKHCWAPIWGVNSPLLFRSYVGGY